MPPLNITQVLEKSSPTDTFGHLPTPTYIIISYVLQCLRWPLQENIWQLRYNPKHVYDFPSRKSCVCSHAMVCRKLSDVIAKSRELLPSHGGSWAKQQATGGVGPLPTGTRCGDSRAARLCGRRGHGVGWGAGYHGWSRSLLLSPDQMFFRNLIGWPSTEVWRLDAQMSGSTSCLGQSLKTRHDFPA